MRQPRVLIIDDEHSFREFLAEALRAHDFSTRTAATAQAGLALATAEPFEAVLLDQNLPDGSGMDILAALRRLPSSPVVIVMTAYAACPAAVDAIKSGAYHYLMKPFDFGDLLGILAEAGVDQGGSGDGEAEALAQLVGSSSGMVELKRQVVRVARSPVANVLIQGESGTGKELVARAIHGLSDRAARPMISINCGALTDTLLMSELFGHERGAFTDARERRKGVFEAAQGGTLFLDEVGEMGARAQAALLRAIEQRRIVRVGGTDEVPVDVRVVAATNRSLAQQVSRGEFRQDLLFRLNIVQLTLPPLRGRGADVRLLAERFSSAIAARYEEPARRISSDAEAVFFAYHWPGNVRELRNAVESAYIIGSGPEIRPADLPLSLRGGQPGAADPHPADHGIAADSLSHLAFADAKQSVIDRFETHYLQALLARNDGNITQAAEEAGILRQVLQRLLKRHGISRDDFCSSPVMERRAAS